MGSGESALLVVDPSLDSRIEEQNIWNLQRNGMPNMLFPPGKLEDWMKHRKTSQSDEPFQHYRQSCTTAPKRLWNTKQPESTKTFGILYKHFIFYIFVRSTKNLLWWNFTCGIVLLFHPHPFFIHFEHIVLRTERMPWNTPKLRIPAMMGVGHVSSCYLSI